MLLGVFCLLCVPPQLGSLCTDRIVQLAVGTVNTQVTAWRFVQQESTGRPPLTPVYMLLVGVVMISCHPCKLTDHSGVEVPWHSVLQDKAEYALRHPGTKTASTLAEDKSKKHCKPNESKPNETKPSETKPNSNTIHPHKRHNNPTHS